MRHILPGLIFLSGFLFASPATSDFLGTSPYQFGRLVNEVMEQVGSEIRFQRRSCTKRFNIACRFDTERVGILVEGQSSPPRIGKVVIEADLLQDKAGAGPLQVVADCVMTLGATMVIMDPRLPAERRVQLLSELMTEVLNTGSSRDKGIDADYALVFDEAASGMLAITITPLGSGQRDSLASRNGIGLGTIGYWHEAHP